MAQIAKHLIINGHVQGVFFRAWTVEIATSQGITGWVRNRANGDVEAVVQGSAFAVARFIEQLRKGPPAAQVEDIRISDVEAVDLPGFEKRATI